MRLKTPARTAKNGSAVTKPVTDAALVVAGVSKSYGDLLALRDVDLAVGRGEIRALLGPNGAGKSTLVSIIAGLRRPDAGTVAVDGLDVAAVPSEAQRHIGLASQDIAVYPTATVRRNLDFAAALMGVPARLRVERVDVVIEALQLRELVDRRAGVLSGGERRRLHTGMAMLHEPTLLLLDEPTAGADVQTRSAVLELVRSLATNGTAVLYSTHYLHEVESLDAAISILDRGEIVVSGACRELIERHGSGMMEVHFDGPATITGLGPEAVVDGNVLRMPAPENQSVLDLLRQLGDDGRRVRSVQRMRPSLEAVYLSVTGRHFGDEAGGR